MSESIGRHDGQAPQGFQKTAKASGVTCRTLMVYLQLGRPNAELLNVVGDLAERFEAGVIGVAATQPRRVGAGEGFLFWDPSGQSREAVRRELAAAEAEFRDVLHSRVGSLEWRSAHMCASICEYLVREMRSADLLVIETSAGFLDCDQPMNAWDFLHELGRPVFVVPALAMSAEVTSIPVTTPGEAVGGAPPRQE